MNTRVYHVTHNRTGKARLIRAIGPAKQGDLLEGGGNE